MSERGRGEREGEEEGRKRTHPNCVILRKNRVRRIEWKGRNKFQIE